MISHRRLLEFMAGDGAQELIGAALRSAPALPLTEAAYGLRYLTDYEVASRQVVSTHARPNAGASVVFEVRLASASRAMTVWTVASTERVPRGAAASLRVDPRILAVEADQEPVQISVWTLPRDPQLPGLEWASNSAKVGAFTGITEPRLTRVVYRPTRRAMVRVSDGTQVRAWAKVLRPGLEQPLLQAISTLEGSSFPFAPVLGAPSEGVIVQAHGRGAPLANLISQKPLQAARMFGQIREVLDALPPAVADLPRQKSWTDRRRHHAKAIGQSIPDLEAPAARLVEQIDSMLTPNPQLVPAHGDFFEANLLTTDGRISTVLDLDSLGPGTRADDYACLLAHVSVLPFLSPNSWVYASATEPWRTRLDQFLPGRRCRSYPESETVLEAWRISAQREVPATDLYARCAAVTLSLVASSSLRFGEAEARARFKRAQWWADLGSYGD
ncbi:phosphotransferase [uncultured Actinomyces sp.]|uniref:phosphotransferase n=1 Tax=uncultured Actinomyces sp. TaxID=249061 RepID=UPI00260FD0D0|nr:phosphotransferase [uncultured Actinomyces sp.]